MKLTDILEFGISGFTVAKLLTVILMVLIGLALVKVLMRLIDKLFQKLRVSVTLLGILRAVIKVLLYFLLVVTVLHFLGIPVTSLIAAMSVVGVALSLGLQNFLGNVVGGVQMLVSQPFEVGDFVEAGGCSGVVQEIGLFYTKILTPDNKLVQEPNSAVVAANIINYTAEKTRRVDLTVTASYDCPVEKVERVLEELVSVHAKVLKTPAPVVHVSNYGPSSIEYIVRAWCATEDYWDVHFDLVKGFKVVFDQNEIEMTYDHLNVHVMKDN